MGQTRLIIFKRPIESDPIDFAERSFVIDGSKAKTIDKTDPDKVRDPHDRMSLELQRAFGLHVSTLFISPDFLELNRKTHPALIQRL